MGLKAILRNCSGDVYSVPLIWICTNLKIKLQNFRAIVVDSRGE